MDEWMDGWVGGWNNYMKMNFFPENKMNMSNSSSIVLHVHHI